MGRRWPVTLLASPHASSQTVSSDQPTRPTSGFAAADELGDGLVELGRFQQVQGDEFAAEPGQRAEQLQVPGQRQAREIDLQKLRVAAPVAGTVKHRVGVVEDVFGRQAGGQAVRRFCCRFKCSRVA